MRLYHYTHKERLPIIQKYGIAKGDVPITPGGGYNAPWFTTGDNWSDQWWTIRTTNPNDTVSCAFDKSEVRVVVEFEENNDKLWKWGDLAKHMGMDPDWFTILTLAGNPTKSLPEDLKNLEDPYKGMVEFARENWHVCHEVVPPSAFIDIEYRQDKYKFGLGNHSGVIDERSRAASNFLSFGMGEVADIPMDPRFKEYHVPLPSSNNAWPYQMLTEFFKTAQRNKK